MEKTSVAILGATGAVGQRFVQLMRNHPIFKIRELAASERSSGKEFQEACRWLVSDEITENVANIKVKNVDPCEIESNVVFSALPGSIAKEIEQRFLKAGKIVISKASAFRMRMMFH